MKQTLLFITMFMYIPFFAAENQQDQSWWLRPLSDAKRYCDKYYNSSFQEQMMGCNNNTDCSEHKLTKNYVQMYAVSADSADLRNHIGTRKVIWSQVANRVLDFTGFKELGDKSSGHTLQSIKNLLSLKEALGTPDLIAKLRKRRKEIKKNLLELGIEADSDDGLPTNTSVSSTPTNSPLASVALSTSQPGQEKN